MNRTVCMMTVVSSLAGVGAAAPAVGQDYVDGNGTRTYYLHRGSTFYGDCWSPLCDCAPGRDQPMTGTFVLSLIALGQVTDFYGVTSANFFVPTRDGQPFNRTLTGTGDFAAGQFPFADHQSMGLSLTISPPLAPWMGVQHLNSDETPRTAIPPVIDIRLEDNFTDACSRLFLRLAASWYRSDWNGSGAVSVQDLFDFLADYFVGNGDYNLSGATSVQDVFDFLGDWFGGT